MEDAPVLGNAFVGLFDIIGFRALRERIGTKELYRLFLGMIAPGIAHSAAGRSKSATVGGKSVIVPAISEVSVQYRLISDTVIFFTRDDGFQSFLNIVSSSFMLLSFGFGIGPAPYRGAIGWGDLMANQDVLVGTAVEDAYGGQCSQAWAGAMLTKACSDFATRQGYCDLLRKSYLAMSDVQPDEQQKRALRDQSLVLAEYDVPMQANPKEGPVRYSTFRTYAIDWTIRAYEGATLKAFGSPSNAHARAIAANTVSFEKWARMHNRIIET